MKIVRLVEKLDGTGDLQKVYDADTIIDTIIKLMNIKKGTYIANPELGTNILDYVFDLSDKHTLNLLVDEVKTVIQQLPGVYAENVDVSITKDKKNVLFKIDLILQKGLRKTITLVTQGEYIYMIGLE